MHRSTLSINQRLPYTGMIDFIFLVIHLLNFKFGSVYTTTFDGVEMRDVFRTVIEYYENPLHVAWYAFAMLSLAVHLSHGFASTFQSLGFNHPKYTPLFKKAGIAFTLLVGIGFSSLAIWGHFQGAQL